jgi:Fic family protein
LADAPNVPPLPENLIPPLANWEEFLHERDRFPDLIHEQFEAIYPFLDRNGRVGRLLNAFNRDQQGGDPYREAQRREHH